ncbi:MAG: hypothetical protein AAGF15_06880 [Pseudomonadota bacterium]
MLVTALGACQTSMPNGFSAFGDPNQKRAKESEARAAYHTARAKDDEKSGDLASAVIHLKAATLLLPQDKEIADLLATLETRQKKAAKQRLIAARKQTKQSASKGRIAYLKVLAVDPHSKPAFSELEALERKVSRARYLEKPRIDREVEKLLAPVASNPDTPGSAKPQTANEGQVATTVSPPTPLTTNVTDPEAKTVSNQSQSVEAFSGPRNTDQKPDPKASAAAHSQGLGLLAKDIQEAIRILRESVELDPKNKGAERDLANAERLLELSTISAPEAPMTKR